MSRKNRNEDTVDESYDEDSAQQRMLESKRELLFARMQGIYDIAMKVQVDSSQFQSLQQSAFNIDQLHKDFERILDSYNAVSLNINPKHTVRYQEWTNFDIMYCYIKQVIVSHSPLTKGESFLQSERPRPKLPAIELRSFDGDIRTWPLFYQQFKCTIHENTSLSDSDKVYYLVGKLSGSAASVCARLPPTAENYPIIWEALIQRYDDPRLLASSYLNQLLSFKSLTANTAAGLELFLDNFDTSVGALKQLSLGDLSEFILLHLALQKLDSETVKSFELNYRREKMPTYSNLIEFVKEQSKTLSRLAEPASKSPVQQKPRAHVPTPSAKSSAQTKSFVNTDQECSNTNNESKCTLCQRDNHDQLYRCFAFKRLTPQNRYKFIKDNSFCTNCLSVKHNLRKCNSTHTCAHCSARHHSLLHFNPPANKTIHVSETSADNKSPAIAHDASPAASVYTPSPEEHKCASAIDIAPLALKVDSCLPAPAPANDSNSTSVCTVSYDHASYAITTALLATAKVKFIDKFNRTHYLRCLIDPGSQSEYISSACSELLSLPICTQSRFSKVQGIGGASQKILGVTALRFSSRFDDDNEYHIKPMIVDHITSQLPDSRVDVSALSHIRNLPMADDDFSEPGPIDLLLGVNVYCQILLFNKVTATNMPVALETTLGYIVMGNAPIESPSSSLHTLCAFTADPLHKLVERFWYTEEPPSPLHLSPDEKRCEEIYTSTTTRNEDGSYVVMLPFKDDPQKLGNSYIRAKRRFLSLERKLVNSPDLYGKYNDIISDYVDKGILTGVSPDQCSSPGYYLPHHPVVRDDKSTTKVRIVLNGSAITDSGLSLNDILYKGYNLQADIFNILLNVRIHRIAFFANVRQMYLFIYTHPALMPKKGHISEFIVDFYHRENSHDGPQLRMSILRQKYWFLSARRLVRHRIHKCLRCFKLNPKNTFPSMADLPSCRVEPCSKAFTHTGVDYAGPLIIAPTRKRGIHSQRAYLCVFVCLVMHIELATDLSSATFLNAFKRFFSRRGPCKFLYSDNGTNFVASQSYLHDLFKLIKTEEYYSLFCNELAKHKITWKRSPPLGSQFGGLWEANIKGIQSFLFRVIDRQILTYEEMLTVLNQVEAVLNSRLLYVLSTDPSPTALTPPHFLCTQPLAFLPAADVSNKRDNLLSRHSLLDAIVQTFWKRFKNEYLHSLQMREKRNTASNPLTVGTIVVLLNNENAPPLSWKLGRVAEVFPGKDGQVRCARVIAGDSSYVRPTTKLSPLPIQ